MRPKYVTVLGANGSMGCNVAAIFASFGRAKVYMVSRSLEASTAACDRAGQTVRAGVIAENLIPVDYSKLDECVSKSDIVFESVSEDMAAKLEVWSRVSGYLQPGTIACTGTSGLSINTLASSLPELLQPYFCGMHFFNPPYAMRLCELCPSNGMDGETVAEVDEYLRNCLRRIVVQVRDSPAFLGNRIGFEFINRALQIAEDEAANGGIDYVDAICGPFSGRAMAPLATADFVGLDVHKAIVGNVYVNAIDDVARDAFALPAFCHRLVKSGHLGRKTREAGGLYRIRNDGNVKERQVYDIMSREYRTLRKYEIPFADQVISKLRVGEYTEAMHILAHDVSREAGICRSLISEYIVYSLIASKRISDGPQSADNVMAAGFNWCPPLAMVEAFTQSDEAKDFVMKSLRENLRMRTDIDELFNEVNCSSEYDYRRYFRAVR